ncbi:MAG: hypothetical protein SCH98_16510 [Deferrisomatales bacterium]|nr:hypothetical protein [Deferrisomatales bacterium]
MKRRQWIAFGVLAAASAVLQAVSPHGAEAHWWDYVPGSYAAGGFAGCVVLILGAKWLGKHALQRGEGYYRDR